MLKTIKAADVKLGDELYREANDSTAYVEKIEHDGYFLHFRMRGFTREFIRPDEDVQIWDYEGGK